MFTQNKNYKNKNVIVGSFLTISEDTTIECTRMWIGHDSCMFIILSLLHAVHAHLCIRLLASSSYHVAARAWCIGVRALDAAVT